MKTQRPEASFLVAKFRIGRIVAIPNALTRLTQDDILSAIQRHQAGEWGDVDEHDRQANELALRQGTRLLSVYHTPAGVKFWIDKVIESRIRGIKTDLEKQVGTLTAERDA